MSTLFAPWKSLVLKSLEKNKKLPNAKYFQLATVRADGLPAVRSVVFRGFRGNTDDITLITDARSEKVEHVKLQPAAEICWYFPESREQYRILGKLTVIGEEYPDAEMLQHSHVSVGPGPPVKMWNSLSQSARDQFAWPHPGLPLPPEEDESQHRRNSEGEAPGPHQAPLSPFCLVILEPWTVDYLSLRGNHRIKFSRRDDESGTWWAEMPVNP